MTTAQQSTFSHGCESGSALKIGAAKGEVFKKRSVGPPNSNGSTMPVKADQINKMRARRSRTDTGVWARKQADEGCFPPIGRVLSQWSFVVAIYHSVQSGISQNAKPVIKTGLSKNNRVYSFH